MLRAVALGLVVFVAILSRPKRSASVAAVVLILGVAAGQHDLWTTIPKHTFHVGVAPAAWAFTASDVVLIASTAGLAIRYGSTFFRACVPALPIALLLIAEHNFWPGGSTTDIGIFHYMLIVPATGLGVLVGRDRRAFHEVALVAAVVMTAETLASIGGYAHLPLLHSTIARASDIAGRAQGTYGHPNLLGYVAVLSLILLLLAVGRRRLWSARLEAVGIASAAVSALIAQSRVAVLAIATSLLGWSVLRARSAGAPLTRASRLERIAIFACVTLALVLAAVGPRFVSDPRGGSRQQLVGIAAASVARAPSGVGPNQFVLRVGKYSPLVASGVPVHNAFLLAAAELGVIGAVLLFLPLLRALWLTVRQRRSGQARTAAVPAADILWIAAPGVLLGLLFDWGLLAGSTFAFYNFVLAVFAGALGGGARVASPPENAQLGAR